MSDQEKSDDLIAELAKLMATNAQGSEEATKPSVIKLTPLSEASVPPPSPVRIPGMDSPKAAPPGAAASASPASKTAAPVVTAPTETPKGSTGERPAPPPLRIPGMEPTAVRQAPSVASEAPLDFSRLSAAGTPPPIPRAATPKPATGPVTTVGGAPATGSAPLATPTRPEPPKPEAMTTATPDSPVGVQTGSGGPPTGDQQDETGKRPQPPASEAPDNEAAEDPIADLIAAELSAGLATKPSSEPETSTFPSSVEAVPASNFGHQSVQAPVLVARPPAASTTVGTAPSGGGQGDDDQQSGQNDRFSVAPVFGLGGRSAASGAETDTRPPDSKSDARPTAPPTESAGEDMDPIDEIESLIGNAVRVDIAAGQQQAAASAQAPVVPPLTTGFAPRRAGLKDREPPMQAAEDAILAAAAATGAEVNRVDTEAVDDNPYKRKVRPPRTERAFGGWRPYIGMAMAATLLLAAGFGLYWVLGMGRGDPESAPVLTADSSPTKQAPPMAAGASDDGAPRSVVFDEIAGVSADAADETLVSRDETAGESPAEVASISTSGRVETTASGLANRKVRTVTVRPDGTIVSGDDAVAGVEALPVERPNVPDLPGAPAQPSGLLQAASAAAAEAAGSTDDAVTDDPLAALVSASDVPAPDEPLDVASLEAPESTAAVDTDIDAPTPMPRPTDRSALASPPAIEANAPATVPLTSVQASPASGGNAAAYVQLSSQRTQGEAQTSLNNVQSRWGSLFQGGQLEIQRADLGERGIYYRVRLPTGSLQEATSICAAIKSNGGDCFATDS